MPTSGALDRVAQKLNLPFYEVKHFVPHSYIMAWIIISPQHYEVKRCLQ